MICLRAGTVRQLSEAQVADSNSSSKSKSKSTSSRNKSKIKSDIDKDNSNCKTVEGHKPHQQIQSKATERHHLLKDMQEFKDMSHVARASY